jgi:hypothetical protein
MTAITDEAEGAGRSRAALLADLHRLIDFVTTADPVGVPEKVTIQIPVPDGLHYEGKLAWLTRVAAAWRVRVLPDGMGGQKAEKPFGAVKLTASVARPDRGFADLKARAAALRSSTAGSGATS